MEDQHVRTGKLHFFLVQDIEILHADVVLFIEEAFLLDTGHIEEIQFWKSLLKTHDLCVGYVVPLQDILTDVVGQAELLGGDQHEADALVANQRVDQRVDGTPEFQVAAQTDGQVVKTPFQGTDRQKIGESLGRVLMAAVSGIDDRNPGFRCRYHGGAFLGMAHRCDICIAGYHADGIRHALSLRCRAGISRRKTKYRAAKIQHCSFEA